MESSRLCTPQKHSQLELKDISSESNLVKLVVAESGGGKAELSARCTADRGLTVVKVRELARSRGAGSRRRGHARSAWMIPLQHVEPRSHRQNLKPLRHSIVSNV